MGEEKERNEFYQRLLLQMIDVHKFPFYDLVIKSQLSEEEMNGIFHLCAELEQKLNEQRELGFVHFTPLLVQFVGMLPHVLNIKETIVALKKQHLYEELMDVLLQELEKIDH